jgi:hypothetical protein
MNDLLFARLQDPQPTSRRPTLCRPSLLELKDAEP